jgi:predicted O-methyltransferase YrrM
MADPGSRTGAVSYASPDVLQWLERVHAPHDGALAAAFAAHERDAMPAIQVGVAEGKLLELIARMIGARRVVEVGTLAGYSTIRLARGMAADGELHTVEFDPRHAAVAERNLTDAKVAVRWQVHVGRGVDVLPTLSSLGPFDLVFIDADKESYDFYGRWARDNLRLGGVLLADNAYLFGNLLTDDARGAAMRRMHEEASTAFETACIPTPDGLLLGLKR